MPLRLRLIALVGLVLLFSLACGSALVAWHEAHSVRTELHAALDGGSKTVRNGIDRLTHVDDPADELRRVVATFNGNRHVRATLADGAGQPVVRSTLFVPTQAVPAWFVALIGGRQPELQVPLPGFAGGGAIVLQADPTNEVGEVWAESRDAVLVLAGFAALSALLISVVVGSALRSLDSLSHAFDRIGMGDYNGLLAVRGPPELRRLASGFNLMTQRLATIAAQNQRLNERLMTLQAEERAELARDLHDEVGPLLFAVDMTAAAIERLADNDRAGEIPRHAHAIRDSVGRMQRHVRVILGRLRPIEAIGLQASIERLTGFWRGRRPDIAFSIAVSISEERIDNDLKETIYRVVQEGTSNAIRHGRPTLVSISVTYNQDEGIRVEVTDDGIGLSEGSATARGSDRLGLVGMRERVMAMAGSLSIRASDNDRGLSLVVRLPCESMAQAGAVK